MYSNSVEFLRVNCPEHKSTCIANSIAVTKFISLLPSGVNDRCSSTTYRDDGTRII